jgi:hypothetical protein
MKIVITNPERLPYVRKLLAEYLVEITLNKMEKERKEKLDARQNNRTT